MRTGLRTRLEKLEQYAGHSAGIAYVVVYAEYACVRYWSGRNSLISLADACRYLNDRSIKIYEATDDFDPERI